jgi:hypothetical protein
MLNEINDATNNEHVEEVDHVQIDDVDRVGFKDVECAQVTLEPFSDHKAIDVTTLI